MLRTVYSPRGEVVARVWEPVRMPRLPGEVLDCVFYLYGSAQEAKTGSDGGGSGFFLSVPWESNREDPESVHIYAVSCHHVVRAVGASVLRVNRRGDSPAILDFDPAEWTAAPANGIDLAVKRVELSGNLQFSHEAASNIMTTMLAPEYGIGLGDDIFSLGRFVHADGGRINKPVAGFGNLAAFPEQEVDDRKGRKQDCYLVEMRSRFGFSGSPVWTYIPPTTVRLARSKQHLSKDEFYGPWLLGMHCGQLPLLGPDAGDGNLSSISYVLPAAQIVAFIESNEKLRAERMAVETKVQKFGAVQESAPPTTADNPLHKEDFSRLLDAVARKRPRGSRT